MPKIKLKYKREHKNTCQPTFDARDQSEIQITMLKNTSQPVCDWCQRPNLSTNAKPKSTSQPACDAKDQSEVFMPYRKIP